ncbi:NAD+ synthase [bacterium]|nr:NAD+ synthase [bacterium]MBT5989015.1 NAD+ synthase [bacterium]
MKITIAQLNPVIGDIPGNLRKLELAFLQAVKEQADLIVFSELVLTGYPPKDLLERTDFLQAVDKAADHLKWLSGRYPQTGILVGLPQKNYAKKGKSLYNAAVLYDQGQEIFSQAKTLLPSYDVFDEHRYFEPAPFSNVVKFKKEILGISICEDFWNIHPFCGLHKLYFKNPLQDLAAQGATILINLSASPFSLDKEKLRTDLIKKHIQQTGLKFIYVNQVGANDDLIFDGVSKFFNEKGELIYRAPAFQENIKTLDLASPIVEHHPLPSKIEQVSQALVLGIKDYFAKTGFQKAVIGLSGGIDSALTAALAVKALGPQNVLGISMPTRYSSEGSVSDSQALAKNLGIKLKIIGIDHIFQQYIDVLAPDFKKRKSGLAHENLQARIRGNILMAYANRFGSLLLSTGNKSEMSVGYCTLYGDMNGGIAVLADVPKMMVYKLAKYLNQSQKLIPPAIITKAPSAELRAHQKDQDSLPPYKILDKIIYYYIDQNLDPDAIVKKGFDAQTVAKVIDLIKKNEYKRKQSPPGLKITYKAFGSGRRMPIAARY